MLKELVGLELLRAGDGVEAVAIAITHAVSSAIAAVIVEPTTVQTRIADASANLLCGLSKVADTISVVVIVVAAAERRKMQRPARRSMSRELMVGTWNVCIRAGERRYQKRWHPHRWLLMLTSTVFLGRRRSIFSSQRGF